jgi:hypothetical protein
MTAAALLFNHLVNSPAERFQSAANSAKMSSADGKPKRDIALCFPSVRTRKRRTMKKQPKLSEECRLCETGVSSGKHL